MQGHASEGQDEVPPPFRRQTFPKNRGQPTELVHRETQANVPTRAVLEIRFLAISRVLSNHQRHFVWGIENKVHYIIDVTFGEDACRLVSDHAQANLAVLRRMALNVVKTYKQQTKSKFSMNLLRQRIGRKSDLLGKVLAMCGMSLMSADVDQKS